MTVDCAHQQRSEIPTDFPLDTEYIMFKGNNITDLSSDITFPSLSKLRKLDLHIGNLRTIGPNSFRHLPALETLILSDNSISTIDSRAFRGLTALRHLDLERNIIDDMPDTVFSGLELESLWLTSNRLKTIGSDTFEGSSVVTLNLSGNAIGKPHAHAFAPLKASLKRFICNDNRQDLRFGTAAFRGVNLTELSLANSRLNKDTSFMEHVNTIRLDLSGNRLPFSSLNLQQYTMLAKAHELRLRNMSLTSISSELLPNSRALQLIDLSENQISAVTSESFKFVSRLTTLLLDYNLLARLPEALTKELPRLRSLSVSNNRITTLETSELTAYADGGLRSLNMQSNRVQVMDESLRPLLDKIGTFMMNGNPLHCNCELLWYRDWLNGPGLSEHGLYTQCMTPSPEYIVYLSDTKLACTVPRIAYVTPDKEVDEDDDVFLTCSAVADPAPEVEWTAPSGEAISITPSQNRSRTKTTAVWRVSSISRSQAGLYRCIATNIKGSQEVSVCIGVRIPGSNRTVCDGIISLTTSSGEMTSSFDASSTLTGEAAFSPPPISQSMQDGTTTTALQAHVTTAAAALPTNFADRAVAPSRHHVTILVALLVVVLIVTIMIIAIIVYIRRRRFTRSTYISTVLEDNNIIGAKTKMADNEVKLIIVELANQHDQQRPDNSVTQTYVNRINIDSNGALSGNGNGENNLEKRVGVKYLPNSRLSRGVTEA